MRVVQKLVLISRMVSDAVKYAETKNAALMAFAGAGAANITAYLGSSAKIPDRLKVGLVIALLSLCVSLLICSVSFVPKTNSQRLIARKLRSFKANTQTIASENLYFFGDLRRHNPNSLLEALNKYYFNNNINRAFSKEELDLAGRIIINSDIASAKFNTFKAAAVFLLFSIVVTILSLLISLPQLL